jgi:hypothetical protein
MTRAKTVSLALLLVAALLIAPAGSAVVRIRKAPSTRPADPKAALLAVLDVERQSQAYYRAVLNKHRPLHPFGMVYRIERQHERTLLDEFAQHAITVPADRPTAPEIAVPETRDEAIAKAVELEKKTVRAYDKAIKRTSGDLRQTLERLRTESLDHQKWFEDPDSCPRGGGGVGVAGGAGGGGGRGRGGRGPS